MGHLDCILDIDRIETRIDLLIQIRKECSDIIEQDEKE